MSNKSHAVVVLPAVRGGLIADSGVRRWLSRAQLRVDDTSDELLARVLSVLGLPPVASGLAALRLWGQTARRPQGWLCGADPVCLEARLDRLCVHALHDVSPAETSALFSYLQSTLAVDKPYAFRHEDSSGYLERDLPMATTGVSANAAHGRSPDAFPLDDAAADRHDALLGELQMCLHESAINRQRAADGRLPANSLWFWGGGVAPQRAVQSLPCLFGDQALFTGYWLSSGAANDSWPGSLAACAAAAGSFVAVPPLHGDAAESGESFLVELRDLLARGCFARLTMLFQNGLHADMRRRDRFRVWRRSAACLEPGGR